MTNRITSQILISLILNFFFSNAYAQNPDCKVRDKDIAGIYKGGCKDGLAEGRALAKGRDVFEGEFHEGDKIKGKYTWASGETYDGEWKNDVQHGQGKSIFPNGTAALFNNVVILFFSVVLYAMI